VRCALSRRLTAAAAHVVNRQQHAAAVPAIPPARRLCSTPHGSPTFISTVFHAHADHARPLASVQQSASTLLTGNSRALAGQTRVQCGGGVRAAQPDSATHSSKITPNTFFMCHSFCGVLPSLELRPWRPVPAP